MKKLKQWLCFIIFAGHSYDIIATEPTYALVRCCRCKYEKVFK